MIVVTMNTLYTYQSTQELEPTTFINEIKIINDVKVEFYKNSPSISTEAIDTEETLTTCVEFTKTSNIEFRKPISVDPPISYGIVNIHLSGKLNKYSSLIKKAFENPLSNIDITTMQDVSNDKYEELFNEVNESLMFLLVSRKHSLGYIGFIKGQYDPTDREKIKHLFVLMTNEEIDLIFKCTFDHLWNSLWKRNFRKTTYNNEYNISKLKHAEVLEKYTINDFKPLFPTREWGFPKGKKNKNESNVSCAIRECCEETSLYRSEITILPGVAPLTELMTGTNGLPYKHIYFIALLENIRFLDLNNEHSQFVEIDTAGWFKKERALNLVRPYHTEKVRIIHQIVHFITWAIYCVQLAEQEDKADNEIN